MLPLTRMQARPMCSVSPGVCARWMRCLRVKQVQRTSRRPMATGTCVSGWPCCWSAWGWVMCRCSDACRLSAVAKRCACRWRPSCCSALTCCCWMNRPTTLTANQGSGCAKCWRHGRAACWWPAMIAGCCMTCSRLPCCGRPACTSTAADSVSTSRPWKTSDRRPSSACVICAVKCSVANAHSRRHANVPIAARERRHDGLPTVACRVLLPVTASVRHR